MVLTAIAVGGMFVLLLGLGQIVGQAPRAPVATTDASPGSAAGGHGTAPSVGSDPPLRSSAVPSATDAGPSSSAAGPSPASDPTLVGAGDIGDCAGPGDEATAALVAAMPGTVFTTGNHAYPNGSAAQFDACYAPTWGRFVDRTRPAAGETDWATPGAAGYHAYFGPRAGIPGSTWYAYDLGTWHIVVLDSDCRAVGGCDPASPQGRWLAADLRAAKTSCTLAIWDRPRWSSGPAGGNAGVAPLWQALAAAGADVVVNGHDADYERFAPQDPAGHEDRALGMREFVVGTGGTRLGTFGAIAANSELRAAISHGVLVLTLRPGSYGWRFASTDSAFSDSGAAACH